MKTCMHCGTHEGEFNTTNVCKACHTKKKKEYNRIYRQTNKLRLAEYNQIPEVKIRRAKINTRYRLRNKEKLVAYYKKYNQTNKLKLAKHRQIPEVKAHRAKMHKAWNKANKDMVNKSSRQWRKLNLTKSRNYRNINNANDRKNLTDSYIRKLMVHTSSNPNKYEPTQEEIQTRRLIIQAERLFKEIENE